MLMWAQAGPELTLTSQYLLIIPGSSTCKNNDVSHDTDDVLYKQSTLLLTAYGCNYTMSHRTGFEHSPFVIPYGWPYLCHFIGIVFKHYVIPMGPYTAIIL